MNENNKRHWEAIFDAQKNSGLSISAWCTAEKVNPTRFYRWKKKLKQHYTDVSHVTEKAVEWVPLKNVTPKQVSIKLNDCGLEIEVSSHFEDIYELENLIKELKYLVKH